MVTFGKLFDTSDVATRALQSSTISATDCLSPIKNLRDMYVQFRENVQNDFDKVLKLTDELMEKNSISNWDVTSTRVRKLPARLKESLVSCSLGKTTAIKENADLKNSGLIF